MGSAAEDLEIFDTNNSSAQEQPPEEQPSKQEEEDQQNDDKNNKKAGKSSGREIPAVGTTPDPTAERDLDNASPDTTDFCGKYACHYCMFVYIASNEVDDELYPFFRAECAEMVKNAELCDEAREQLNKNPEVQGASHDRRLKAIEAQTQCGVHLGKLHGPQSMIKGLPRRRLTIAGPSFTHIGHALEMVEHMFPRLMQFAVHPYRFPEEADQLKYQSNRTFDHHMHDAHSRSGGTLSLTPQIDDKSTWKKYLCPKTSPSQAPPK